MSGHCKFSQLTEHFSEERQVEITQKTAQLKAKIAQRLKSQLQEQNLPTQVKSRM